MILRIVSSLREMKRTKMIEEMGRLKGKREIAVDDEEGTACAASSGRDRKNMWMSLLY